MNPLHPNRDTILANTGNGYWVFAHYLAARFPSGRVEAGRNISNPFLDYRQQTPSFNIYQDSSGVWRFKDFAHTDCRGDCFELVARMNGLDAINDFASVLDRIQRECGLADERGRTGERDRSDERGITGEHGVVGDSDAPPASQFDRADYNIEPKEFTQRDLDYWGQYGIGPDLLERYGLLSLDRYTARRRDGGLYTVPATAASPIYAYPYGPNGYKIYRPLSGNRDTRFRFIGLMPEELLWGWDRLPAQCRAILLAAGEKDTLAAVAHGFNAVTLNSETARLSQSSLRALLNRSRTILCCYDIDETGRTAAQRLWREHGVRVISLPAWIAERGGKDVADFFRLGGTTEEFQGVMDVAIREDNTAASDAVDESDCGVRGVIGSEELDAASNVARVNRVIAVHGVNAVNPTERFHTSETAARSASVKSVNGVKSVNAVNRNAYHYSMVDAVTLSTMEFTEPEWIVEGMLPSGLAILCGRPKHGKSWLALNLALAAANGGTLFGKYRATPCTTLYLALEDTNRRLQKRLAMLLSAEATSPPRQLRFITEFRRFDNGGFDDLAAYLATETATRLVIIDTLAKLRGRQRGGRDTYAGDYEEIGELQAIALRFNVAIVVVHHSTKMHYNDPFDAISGTSGVAGAADTLFVLKREHGGTTLHIRGRDIEESAVAMKFDPSNGTWSAIGDAAEVRISEERRRIIEAVEEGDRLSPKEIAAITGLPYGSVRHLCRRIVADGMLVETNSRYAKPRTNPDSPVHSVHTMHTVRTVR